MSQQGLPVSNLINVQVDLSPAGAQALDQSVGMIIGDTPGVIKVNERWRQYSGIAGVAADFGTTVPEYLAALNWFAQVPQPTSLLIGRWASAGTYGYLQCGPLTGSETLLATWNAITTGSFAISVNGAGPTNITGLNFSGAATFAAIATLITTALSGASIAATCTFVPEIGISTNGYFLFTTNASGAGKTIAPLTAPGSGTDIHATPLNGTKAAGAVEIDGIATESALTALTIIEGLVPFYGVTFAAGAGNVDIADADHEAIAAYIEADANKHIYGVSTQEPGVLVPTTTTDIASVLQASGYNRTFVQYSSTDPFVAASYLGRLLTVDLSQSNSSITMMYKQEPGVTPEELNQTQESALQAKNCNVYATYNNNTQIIQFGTQCSGLYTDSIFGIDGLQSEIQTDCFNLLYETDTKIPQTDAGNHQLATEIAGACQKYVVNGVLAPGIWTAGGFGQLTTGQLLKKGYYVYQPPISTQSEGDRAARKSVPFQVAAKLAGAIHEVFITVNVNQ